jgi:hypothetical protein
VAVDMAAAVMPVFQPAMAVGMGATTAVATVGVQWAATMVAAIVAVRCVGDIMAGAGMGQAMLAGTEEEGFPTGTLGCMAIILIIRIMAAVLGPFRGTGKPAGIPTCRGIWRFMILHIATLTAARKRMASRV